MATAKLGILQYCHAVRNESNKENIVRCIVGEELEWSENQAIVSFVAEVCKSVEEKSALVEKCESQNRNIYQYRELVDELNRKIRESKQDSILHSYELESELRDLKESNMLMSTVCDKSKKELRVF